MPDVRKLSVRVDRSGPRIAPVVLASDLIPPAAFAGESTALVPFRFATLRLCTEDTFQEFTSCPAADLWELTALHVGLDPGSFCPRVRINRVLAVMDLIARCRALPADDVDPLVQLFLSNLARAERALLEGGLQTVPDTDSNRPAALWTVTAEAYATWARKVRLPSADPSGESHYVSPLLALCIAAARKFYSFPSYVRGDRSTEPNGKVMEAWIRDRLPGQTSSSRMPASMYWIVRDQGIPRGNTPTKK